MNTVSRSGLDQSEYEQFLKSMLSLLDDALLAGKVEQEFLFMAQESKLGRTHKELVTIFRCDVQEVWKEAFAARQTSDGKLTNQLEALAHVEHVTPRYCDLRSLFADGIGSAKEIADMPDEAFVDTFKTRRNSQPNDAESKLLLLFKRWLNWRTQGGRED